MSGWSLASGQLAAQWTEPGDIFSVLLIVGGEVVQLALAAVAGGPGSVAPVVFSFGWVAYAVSAVVSAVGDNRLLCRAPEVPLRVINLRSGYQRDNLSWLLGRALKTYDFWMPEPVRERLRRDPRRDRDDDEEGGSAAPHVALCVAVYRWRAGSTPGRPTRDLVWWSGFVVTLASWAWRRYPLGVYHDWSILLTTAAGTLLAYASGSLPQWRIEKWHARRRPKDVAITLGNGAQHVVVVRGSASAEDQPGLDLEDLAAGRAPNLSWTRAGVSALAVLWLVLLITCIGIKVHTWYLLAVGGVGMLHNIVMAGAPRRPEALGLPLELVSEEDAGGNAGGSVFAEPKVMWALMTLERYEGYGRALLPEFFPGKLRPWEETWWETADGDERRRLLAQTREDEKQKALKKKQK